jgi:hypothetical protein
MIPIYEESWSGHSGLFDGELGFGACWLQHTGSRPSRQDWLFERSLACHLK